MRRLLLIATVVSSFLRVLAHPIPDIPVLGSFYTDGNASILVEIDTRSFAEDPESVPFLIQSSFDELSSQQKEDLLLQGKLMVSEALEIKFGHRDWHLPDFVFSFTEKNATELSEENIVVIRASHQVFLPSNSAFYQIRAKNEAAYDLIFTNIINDEPQRRVNVLFPGEESFQLDLSFIDGKQVPKEEPSLNSFTQPKQESIEKRRSDARSTFLSFSRQGFVHVYPLGLDHILFVLGLFFLSRKWKPILYQVSVFTIAHTITLGLATLDLVSAPSHVVEPIIAASIAVVAIENILFPGYRHSRLFVVFFFGLIHGLGFAGALSAFNLEPTSLAIGLLGFNIGVELGQLAVIYFVFVVTYQFSDEFSYRKFVVIPGSSLIALMGIYWTIERVFF